MSEEYITKTQVRELMERYYENANLRQDHFLRSVFRDIKALPAADVVEVVHGEWEPFDLVFGRSIYVCTACERAVKMPTAMGLPTFKYCPNCGAKMIVMHEPDINPCRGCDDYDGIGECVSDGGCAGMDGDIDDKR